MAAFLIISLLFFCCYAALILLYRFAWMEIPEFKPTLTKTATTIISVIIAARNEEKNIGACLESIVQQDYQAGFFEVLVVDDHSDDQTPAIIRAMAQKHSCIRYIPLKEYLPGEPLNAYKKKAIETGISLSRGSLIVTTDADCIAGPNWLSTIAHAYESKHAACLVMPVCIKLNNKPGGLALFQSLDVLTLQGITGAAIHRGWHGMCNGANFAYEKKLFVEVGGFTGINHIASGDDMLLLHKITARYPDRVMYVKSKDVIIQTKPEKTVRDFLNQRIRWAGKSAQYEDKRLLPVLTMVYLFNVLMLVWGILSFTSAEPVILIGTGLPVAAWFCILLVLKTILEYSFVWPVARFFTLNKLLPWFFIMQPFHIMYTCIAGLLGAFGTYSWKGRRVR